MATRDTVFGVDTQLTSERCDACDESKGGDAAAVEALLQRKLVTTRATTVTHVRSSPPRLDDVSFSYTKFNLYRMKVVGAIEHLLGLSVCACDFVLTM